MLRYRRYDHFVSVGMLDLDEFKQVNDTYGHQCGDLVLKELAQCFAGSIRNNVDWIARYGGEEFLIVLPETDINGARLVAERLRRIISEKIIGVQEKEINITVSLGVTGFDAATPDENISSEAMIGQADRYLYQAKDEGRNRVRAGRI